MEDHTRGGFLIVVVLGFATVFAAVCIAIGIAIGAWVWG